MLLRRWLLIALLAADLVAPAWRLPLVTKSDDFNRSDSSSLGGNWTMTRGAFHIASNRAVQDPGGLFQTQGHWNTSTDDFGDDQFSEVQLPDVTNDFGGGPTCRHSGSNPNDQLYVAYYDDDNAFLYKITNSTTFTDLSASLSAGANDNDIIKIVCTGGNPTTLKVYKNGSQDGNTVNDSSSPLTGGQPGIFSYSTDLTQTLDNWQGGDETGAPTNPPPPLNNPIIYRLGFGQRANPADNEAENPDPPAGWCQGCAVLTAGDFAYLGIFRIPTDTPDWSQYGGRALTGRIVGGQTRLFINQGGSGQFVGKWAPLEVADPGTYSQTFAGASTASVVCNWGFNYQAGVKYDTWADKVGDTFDPATGTPMEMEPAFTLLQNYAWQGGLLHATYSLLYGNYIPDWNHVAVNLQTCNPNGSVATTTTAYGPWRTYNGLYADGTKVFGPSRHSDLTICPDGKMCSGSAMLNYQNNYGSAGPSLVGGADWPTATTPVGFGTAVGGGQRSTDLVNPFVYLAHASLFGHMNGAGQMLPGHPVTSQRRPGSYLFEDVGCNPHYGPAGIYLDPTLNSGTGSWTEIDGGGNFELINGNNKWGFISFQTFGGRHGHDGGASCTTGKSHIYYQTCACPTYQRNAAELACLPNPGGPQACPLHECFTGVTVTGPTANVLTANWAIYDPDDLIEVKDGTLQPYAPNPTFVYPLTDIDPDIEYTTGADPGQKGSYAHGDSWYDTVNRKLYILLLLRDTTNITNVAPVVAVFSVSDSATPAQLARRALSSPALHGGLLATLVLVRWLVRRPVVRPARAAFEAA